MNLNLYTNGRLTYSTSLHNNCIPRIGERINHRNNMYKVVDIIHSINDCVNIYAEKIY